MSAVHRLTPSALAGLAVAAFTLAALPMGCTNGKASGSPPAPPPSPSADGPAEKAEEKAAAADVASTRFASFPAVPSYERLSELQKAAFAQMANEEICPCDCPKSWAACLQEGTQCKPAVLLAEWAVGQLADGVEPEVMAEQIAEEIGGFSSRPKDVKTAPYAKKGSEGPKYTIVEYADFECAHCKMASIVVSELVRRHGGEVQVVYKHFPLSFHPMAKTAAAAAEAAGQQGKFWEMHDAIFATQNMLDEELLKGHARALGLDVKKWQRDRASEEIVSRVEASRKEGERIGVEATPTFLVNGRPFNLMRTLDAFELRFAMEDARKSSSCR